MVFGFAIKRENGSTTFGVVKADTEDSAKKMVAEEADVDEGTIRILSAEEALSQFDDVALLSPAEA